MGHDITPPAPENLPPFSNAIVGATSAPDCPNDRTLLRYADLSLNREEREKVERHLVDCTECACFVAELQRISAPVVRLHRKGIFSLGWLHLSRGGHLSSSLEEAWSLHRATCSPCERKATLLERIGLRFPASESAPQEAYKQSSRRLSRILTPALSFGMGILLMFLFYRPTAIEKSNLEPGSQGKERVVLSGIDLSTTGRIQAMLTPTPDNPSRQASQLDAWRALPQNMEFEKQASLGGIYLRIAQTASDTKNRASSLQSSRESLLKAQLELDRKLKTVNDLLDKMDQK